MAISKGNEAKLKMKFLSQIARPGFESRFYRCGRQNETHAQNITTTTTTTTINNNKGVYASA